VPSHSCQNSTWFETPQGTYGQTVDCDLPVVLPMRPLFGLSQKSLVASEQTTALRFKRFFWDQPNSAKKPSSDEGN